MADYAPPPVGRGITGNLPPPNDGPAKHLLGTHPRRVGWQFGHCRTLVHYEGVEGGGNLSALECNLQALSLKENKASIWRLLNPPTNTLRAISCLIFFGWLLVDIVLFF